MASLATTAQPMSLSARPGAAEVPRLSLAARPGLVPYALATTSESDLAQGAAGVEAVVAPTLSLAARRGMAVPGLPAISLEAQKGAAAKAPTLSLAARRGALMVPSLPSTNKGAVHEVKPAPAGLAVATSLTARRGVPVVPPLSLNARPGAAAESPPLALCARRGSAQLQVQVSRRSAEKDVLPLGFGCEPGSPTPSLSDLSTCGSWPDDDPLSPSCRSDSSMEDWGFEVGEELGAGSMAFVQKVTRRSDGRQFAAKRMRSSEQEQLKGLQDEYKLVRSLSHSGIVRAEAFFQGRLGACLCMELCGGGTVGDHVEAHGAFSEPRAQELSLQLLEGIDHLHCRRVVHRDIKPANLLLLPEATCLKIGDFGSARRIGRGAGGGAMLSHRGTQLYSAPELRFGRQWNERVDVWASGLCAFVMLRAVLPFDGGSRAAARLLCAGRLPKIPWGVAGAASRSLVLQCLTPEMRDRPTAMELLLHPAFAGLRPGSSNLAPREPGARCADPVEASLPMCGLLASPAGRALPGPSGPRGPREQALQQLARNRHLRATEGPLPGQPATHDSPI